MPQENEDDIPMYKKDSVFGCLEDYLKNSKLALTKFDLLEMDQLEEEFKGGDPIAFLTTKIR